MLAVCLSNLQFIYVLSKWEGSAADGRVLRDTINRPNGLIVSRDQYYLVDAGYTNGEGFLAPFGGQRYHLNEWRHGHQPTTPEEFFNVKHSPARNVIERCFGILKARWAILRSASFFPIIVQNRIIMACCLLHNFIRNEMPTDPFEELIDPDFSESDNADVEVEDDVITSIGTSPKWTTIRATLATSMFNEWKDSH